MKKISVLLASLLMAACASTSQHVVPAQTSEKQATSEHATTSSQLSAAEIESRRLAAEKAALLDIQKKSIYFDLDQYAVKPEFQGAVQNQADFMKSHDIKVVTLEGNADERGSNEYNLALGDRRASAVKKNLLQLGIPENKIHTVSLGEEKPRQQCHEEKCWADNRRVDFVHQPNM